MNNKPLLYTCISPSLLHLYDVNNSIVVIIDVFRATSTIATALHNKAKNVIPVASVSECIELGAQLNAIMAAERDGLIVKGIPYGNSPFEFSNDVVEAKTIVLTTTNGTKLLHMALDNNPKGIITGSFPNLSAVCDYLVAQKQNVILGCAAWRDKVNIEDTLFAGAVINRIKDHFDINCDSSKMAETIYLDAKEDLFGFMKAKNASHYQRLSGYGLDKDMQYCLTADGANVLVIYEDGKLVSSKF